MQRLTLLLILGLPALAIPAGAVEETPSGRAVDTDPANFVEGPFTLEVGRSQIEWGVFAYGRDRLDGFSVESRTLSAIVLRTAFSPSLELQVFHGGHGSTRVKDLATGASESIDGLGDTTLQLKKNFFGNDQGRFALGGTVFAILNTGAEDIGAGRTIVGGSLVFAANLFESEMGSLTAHSQIRNCQGASIHHFEFSQSIVFGRDLDDRNSVAAEINAYRSTEAGAKTSLLSSVTFTHAFTDVFTLDVAVTAGLNREAEDAGAFLILTRWF